MDSITQAALGASVAYLCWHKPLGRKSLLLGAGFGTLPDLDILVYPFLDDIQKLHWHRGESHSIWFITLGAFLIAWLLHRYKFKDVMTLSKLYWGVFWIFATHVLIDYFTIYGTQLLAPFSRYGFAHGNLFIIDPLFTLPLLFGIIGALFNKVKLNIIALTLSSFYAIFSLLAHSYAHHKFSTNLEERGLHVKASMSSATAFNTLLWRHVAQTPDGLVIAYLSLLDKDKTIEFQTISQNKELIEPFMHQANIKTIDWFSKGFWIAQKKEENIIISDVRFGEIRPFWNASPSLWQYSFSWIVTDDEKALRRVPRFQIDIKEALKSLFEKI